MGGQPEPNTVHYDLFKDRRILIASPQYVSASPKLDSPQDLKQHHLLAHSNTKYWGLAKDGNQYRVPMSAVMHCNTGDFLAQLAESGVGIASKSQWSVEKELKEGRLVRVLEDYTVGTEQKVQAILPKRDYLPARVSYVLGLIKEHLNKVISDDLKLIS